MLWRWRNLSRRQYIMPDISMDHMLWDPWPIWTHMGQFGPIWAHNLDQRAKEHWAFSPVVHIQGLRRERCILASTKLAGQLLDILLILRFRLGSSTRVTEEMLTYIYIYIYIFMTRYYSLSRYIAAMPLNSWMENNIGSQSDTIVHAKPINVLAVFHFLLQWQQCCSRGEIIRANMK